MVQLDGSFSHLVAVKGSVRVADTWDLIDPEHLPSLRIWPFAGNCSSSLCEPHHRSAHTVASCRVSNERDREMEGMSKGGGGGVSQIEIAFTYKLISEMT